MKFFKQGMQAMWVAVLATMLAVPAFAGTVDINKADAVTLAKELKGVGPAKAKAIVEYRTKNGMFKSVDDLVKVEGIGDRLLAQIRSNLVVGSAADASKKVTQ